MTKLDFVHAISKISYVYTATLLRVIDGDTIEVDLDFGFEIRQKMLVRLAHINAPEHNTPEGKKATEYLATLLLSDPNALTLTTYKPKDKYGRYLAVVFADTVNVNQAMIDSGNAVPYEGGGK